MSETLEVSVGQHSEKGCKALNQDFHGVRVPDTALCSIKGIAIAMADGISSSAVSQMASEVAVTNFLEDYYCTSEAWSVKNSVERVLNATNAWLHSHTVRGPDRYDLDKGYVCTLSAMVIKNDRAHIFHVGDTRVYRLTQNGLEQLTHDHRLWVSETKSHLSRAMGLGPKCVFDHQQLVISPGDIFIIATDGVYEFIKPNMIIDTIHQYESHLPDAARAIVEHALQSGSQDNLSVQILRIDQIPEANAPALHAELDHLPFPPELSARMHFDGYTVLRELHRSSRSLVYLAQDQATQRNVVLKIPTRGMDDVAGYLDQFLTEEWIARRMHSAYVLKADVADKKRNFLYTVFEYIEGQNLAQWATDNPKPSLETVRGLIEQIAKGLHAFHRLEMLHQDIKPENIIIDTQGTVKIIDFGSVSVAGLNETLTAEPHTYLQGTALYSAPEYFLGEPGTVTSELFSLGVITYFLLSGRYPYDTHVARTKTLSAQKKLHYRSLMDEERDIPHWVDYAIRTAVQPLPEKRQHDIFEFVHDLRQPSKDFLSSTRPPLMDRNPVAVWQGLTIFFALIILYLLAT